ncbi:MFS transporter [Ostreiculturibacter nitratireducens]|uniref:MFS transporter n=1 Tax=Ostreiculturibacter nitratireducens TaxID=3075226 RepID=UPI0031B5E1EB
MSFLLFLRENARWLAAGALLSFLSSFGQTFFISIFAGEIRAEFGLSHGQWGAIYSIGTGASAALMLWAGGLADRFRVMVLGPAVVVLLALACTAMALNPSALLLPFVIFALRFTGQGMASHVSLVAMARWFVATRGRALAVATLGFQAGEATMPLSFVALKRLFDWHSLWLFAAVFVLATIPVLVWLLKEERTPQAMAEINSSPGMGGRHWTRAEALRHPLVWTLLPGLAGFSAFNTAFWFQQVHFAAVKGWEHLSLVALFPLGTGAFILSTAAFGWALDRFGSPRLMPLYLLPVAAGFTFLGLAPSVPVAGLGIVLIGVAGGGQATLPSACWAEFYGTRNIGSIKAAVASALVLGSALGPGISGFLIDAGIAMPTQLLGYAVWFIAASALMVRPIARARAELGATAQVDVVGT